MMYYMATTMLHKLVIFKIKWRVKVFFLGGGAKRTIDIWPIQYGMSLQIQSKWEGLDRGIMHG